MKIPPHNVMWLAADRNRVAADRAQIARLVGVARLLVHRFRSCRGHDWRRCAARDELPCVDLLPQRTMVVALSAAVGWPCHPKIACVVPDGAHAGARSSLAVWQRQHLRPMVAIQARNPIFP